MLGLALNSGLGARADTLVLPPSLAPLVLSDTVPFAFRPVDFGAEDFVIEWAGTPIPGVEFRLGEESIEWVRVVDAMVLPRARLILKARGFEGGVVTNAGFSQAFVRNAEGALGAEMPLALFSGDLNAIEVAMLRDQSEVRGRLRVRFRPKKENRGRILIDSTCSPHSVRVKTGTIPDDSWMYVGCRMVYVEGERHPAGSLEMLVFWDGVGQEIAFDGVRIASSSVSLWPLRLRHAPGLVRLGEAELAYSLPERVRMAAVGLGIGPYQYTFRGNGQSVDTIAPVATIYGSYFINERMRIALFNAIAVHEKYFSDMGLYLVIEQIRAIDERFSLNLLLGVHALAFRFRNNTFFRPSAPQGAEAIFRDFLVRSHNLGVGAFIHPVIFDRAYYNIWIRWGKPSFFGEFNYILWREGVQGSALYNRSVGLSVGFPIARFL